ncbi:hypothetical protein SAMN05192588_2362 [Nonlabens sp. Hel1_33_55]|uniref:hypothetical protein n=1 Tax=Nonlabens sp. Hel1_33_55 TaxID=1336802 RepID=UPI000875AC01|nr:hypothetical protein [Nonlabens sp. Hel1_33_55]SCY34048.1 hypothetical protein SAMN05192588_2362 [Nonlabens sp. Hel1_33_55]
MKQLLQLSILAILFSTTSMIAQNITAVKYSLFEKTTNDHRLRVTPSGYDGNAAETTKTSGVYAVMICYTYNDREKSVYQDITSKFVNGEDYIFTFSFGTASLDKLKLNNVTFFRRDKPKETWPSKEGCNSGQALTSANTFAISSLYNL